MNKLEQLSTAELLAEIKKRKTANVSDSPFLKKKSNPIKIVPPDWLGKFTHELPNSSQREKFAQYSTPPHIAEFMVKLANNCQEGDFKDQIIYEPFVGAGAMFLPLRNKGAVLIGSDIDLEALEICKQLVPEAILIHHDTVGCLEPQSNIRHFQKKIEEIKAQPKKTKPQIAKDTAEIARLEKKIEQEKLRTPWRWDYYCVEHLYHEPKETFLRLTKILRDREITQMRKEHNNGETMYFRCFNCSENVIDYQVCEDQAGNIICRPCYHKTD